MPTPRDNFDRLMKRARAAWSDNPESMKNVRAALGERAASLALMSAASHWSVVEALETVLKKLTRETARNEENDALLDALRIATEGLEDCGRFAAMIARDAKGA